MQSVMMEVIPGKILPMCYASKGDNKREIEMILVRDGEPYNLMGDEILNVTVRRPDIQIFTISVPNNGGNKFILTISSEVTEIPGRCSCSLRISEGEEQIYGLTNFILEVEDL